MSIIYKKISFFVFLVIFVFSLFLLNTLHYESQNISSEVGFNKIYIELKSKNGLKIGLTKQQVENLKSKLNAKKIIYYSGEKTYFSSDFREVRASIIGIKGDLNSFYNVNTGGSSVIFDEDSMQNKRVVILSEELALQLFGTVDVIGFDVNIYNQKFKVAGIIEKNNNKVYSLFVKDSMRAFVPFGAIENCKNQLSPNNGKVLITNIEIKSDNINLENVKTSLSILGIDYENYNVEIFDEYGIKIYQNYKIMIFLIALICVALLIQALYYIIKRVIGVIRAEIERNYFIRSILNIRKRLTFYFAISAGMLFLIILLLENSKFDFYLVYSNLQDEILRLLNTKDYLLSENVTLEVLYKLSFLSALSVLVNFIIVFIKIYRYDIPANIYISIFAQLLLSVVLNAYILLLLGFSVNITLLGVFKIAIVLFIIILSRYISNTGNNLNENR